MFRGAGEAGCVMSASPVRRRSARQRKGVGQSKRHLELDVATLNADECAPRRAAKKKSARYKRNKAKMAGGARQREIFLKIQQYYGTVLECGLWQFPVHI